MRVTQGMISTNLLRNLNQSYQELDKYFNQLNTGKKFNRPSEDPVSAMKGINFRTELNEIEQYQRNTNEAHHWFDNTDSALEQINSGLQRVRYLAVQASNGTYGGPELKNVSEEVKQIRADLEDMANTKFNEGTVTIEVAAGSMLDINVNGRDVFTNEDGESLFAVLDQFVEKLDNGSEEIDQMISDLDEFIDLGINARADLGARMNRLDLIENRLSQQEIVATSSLSQNEDVDYAETITKLITQESIHRAALSSGARIMQPTLLDFLR